MEAFRNAPLHSRAGFVLRGLFVPIASTVSALSNQLWNYPNHNMTENLLRFVGVSNARVSVSQMLMSQAPSIRGPQRLVFYRLFLHDSRLQPSVRQSVTGLDGRPRLDCPRRPDCWVRIAV